jgi:Tol biopolymer transport system component
MARIGTQLHRGLGRALVVVGTLCGAATLVVATDPAAFGAYPSYNGDIAFASTRNNNVAIYQVNPGAAPVGTATGDIGTSSGDQENTTELTAGATDAEPFYSPDGKTVYFSSDRTNNWEIYSIAQSSPDLTSESSPTDTATELSQSPTETTTDDDYSPSVAPDGETVVFNRNNDQIWTVYASKGYTSACELYQPPTGLAPASSDNGSGSRIAFDPVNQSELAYVGGDNHLHLLTGIPTPTGTNPCGVSASSLTDTDLSAEATSTTGDVGTTGYADADPDWSSDGTSIVFDSTRGASGGNSHELWKLNTTTIDVEPLWPSMVGNANVSATQPVYSPDDTEIAFTEPVSGSGTQVNYEIVPVGMSIGSAVDVSLSPGKPVDSQPDWQPLAQPTQGVPESPMTYLLPVDGLVVLAGGLILVRRRRRTHPATL